MRAYTTGHVSVVRKVSHGQAKTNDKLSEARRATSNFLKVVIYDNDENVMVYSIDCYDSYLPKHDFFLNTIRFKS